MIIPGLDNKWGVLPASPIDGWVQLPEMIHWRRDTAEETRLQKEWRDIFPDKSPQTNGDWAYFSNRYKSTKL